MQSYHSLLKQVLASGQRRGDRTGVGTISVFGAQWWHDLSTGFPILTTKKVHWKSVVYELLWFLRGDTNIKFLKDNGVRIWDEWADENGDLGPVYGKQWRTWNSVLFLANSGIDQIAGLIHDLKTNPFSRRHIVTAWNPAEVPLMKLPPCHTLWQCYVRNTDEGLTLDLHLYARSIDIFLGLPFNIASYALLTHILADLCNYRPGRLIISFGDLHIYSNHLAQVNEQLDRVPRQLPRLITNGITDIDKLDASMFALEGYDPHPAIKAQVAV